VRQFVPAFAAAFAATLVAHNCVYGQSMFGGPIELKGRIAEGKFHSHHLDIVSGNGKFVITCKKNATKFAVPFTRQSLQDVAISLGRNAVAVALNGQEWRNPLRALVTVTDSGKVRVFEYKMEQLTKHYGWIVELGAVSNDGRLVLAKCATFRPMEDGIRHVRHDWVILAFGDSSLKALEVEAAIDKWPSQSRHKE